MTQLLTSTGNTDRKPQSQNTSSDAPLKLAPEASPSSQTVRLHSSSSAGIQLRLKAPPGTKVDLSTVFVLW